MRLYLVRELEVGQGWERGCRVVLHGVGFAKEGSLVCSSRYRNNPA